MNVEAKTFTISQKSPATFGPGASLLAADKFVEFGCKKILVVTDKNVRGLGITDPIIEAIKAKGIGVEIYDEVLPDPKDIAVDTAADFYKEKGCDGIMAVGGGSVMDTAKGVKLLSKNPGKIAEYFGYVPIKVGDPLILVVTTIGTGSECSNAMVLLDTEKNLKRAVLNPKIIGDASLIDSNIQKGIPKNVLAFSITDIMLHTVETMTSSQRNLSSSIMAKGALEICAKYADKAMEGDEAAIYAIGFASTYASMAFSDAMLHVGHHIAHTLGAYFHTPHGECCSITLPAFCRFMVPKMPEEMKEAAIAIGINPESPTLGDDMAEWFKAFSKKLGLRTARECEYDLNKMMEMKDYVNSRTIEPNSSTPFEFTHDEIGTILDDIYNT